MSDPIITEGSLEADARDLDELEKNIDGWTDGFLKAEEAWDALWDAVSDDLKQEMNEQGRKGDPSEHRITSVCRQQHRAEYQALRRAKKKLDSLQPRVKAKTQAASSRQTQVNVDLKLSGITVGQQPQWSQGRRAE